MYEWEKSANERECNINKVKFINSKTLDNSC